MTSEHAAGPGVRDQCAPDTFGPGPDLGRSSGPDRDRYVPAPALAPAKIKLLYESRDKQLCLFEDAGGHLTAVRAARLA